MKQISSIVIGAGQRGNVYADFARRYPEKLEIIGVAEPNHVMRTAMREMHNIKQENCFDTWEQVFEREKFADTVMICTHDSMHFEPVMAAIAKGYDILLEKPMSPNAKECAAIANAADAAGVKVVVCHVLRYSPLFKSLKRIIKSGEIGDVVSVVHNENVGDIHASHSFVRGNWGNTAKSAPMILSKSCHDMDIIQWLIGKKCLRLNSFGSLSHFNIKNKPDGAPPRCTDGCNILDCPYDSRKLYLKDMWGFGEKWFRPVATGLPQPTDDEVLSALQAGPYGRCVFQTDNDVVDHQSVNMEFEGGITALFSMSSLTPDTSRSIKIMGTKGQIRAHSSIDSIGIDCFSTRLSREVKTVAVGGHGGGDIGIMEAFCEYVATGIAPEGISEARISAENHMLCFAAEQSRLNDGETIEL